MKLLIVIEIFCSFWPHSQSHSFLLPSFDDSNLSAAVNEIILSVFAIETPIVNLMSPYEFDTFALKDFRDKFLTNQSTRMSYRSETSSYIKELPGRKRRNSVIFIETIDGFREMLKKVSPGNHRMTGLFVAVLTNGEIAEIEYIFKMFWSLQIFNVIVIFEDDNSSVIVKTFMPFSGGICNDTSPITINEFRDGKFVNGTENLFPKKFSNMHNCPLRVATSNESVPYVIVRDSNGTFEYSGRDIDLLNTLAEDLKFTIEYTFVGLEGFSYEGPLQALKSGAADLAIADLWLKPKRLEFLDSTMPYNINHLVFVIPPGLTLTAYEKLIFPFHFSLWIAILSCFIVGLLVICVIKHCPKAVKTFVFGTRVNHPSLNMLVGFIGGTQKVLPRRNFARFLLMMFLLYSLVIRTVYQASYYHLQQSNACHKIVETIDEMIEKKFTFYIFDYNMDLLQDVSKLKSRSEFISR